MLLPYAPPNRDGAEYERLPRPKDENADTPTDDEDDDCDDDDDDDGIDDVEKVELNDEAEEAENRFRHPPLNMALTSSQACSSRSSLPACASSRWRRQELKLAAAGWR